MAESRYVSASRLMVMVRTLAVTVVVLMLATFVLDRVAPGSEWRRVLTLVWLIALPVVGLIAWRRSGSADH